MKTIRYILASLLGVMFFYGCDQGIDGITQVDPGADASAPQIKINAPTEGNIIKELETESIIALDLEVTDDIELGTIKVDVDGKTIGTYSSFKDYRRFLLSNPEFDMVEDGDHALTATATDLEGKSTTSSINFTKVPPYISSFPNEIFYMPFDRTYGDYGNFIGRKRATKSGEPSFAGEGLIGADAYLGAEDSYLLYPASGLLTEQFTAAFWYRVNASPDRAGILVINDDADDRLQGLRLFREGNANEQTIIAIIGTGTEEVRNNGGVLNVTSGNWVHIAISISPTQNTIYFNGEEVNTVAMTTAVDWTGVEDITIGAGGETFSYWGHLSDLSEIDDLRLFDKALSATELQDLIGETSPYIGDFAGEMFYMPFDNNYINNHTDAEATAVGSPGFAGESVEGSNAYAGASDSYLTFPSGGLTTEEFSATLWYKMNPNPDRNGILVMGPEDTERPEYPDVQNLRTSGFRLFREITAGNPGFKLNVGTGDGETWVGDAASTIDPLTSDWIHLAFTISDSKAVLYIDGEAVAEGSTSGIDWTGCDILSIGSGAPRFNEWGHFSDLSYLDELRLYNKALSQEEIQNIRNSDL